METLSSQKTRLVIQGKNPHGEWLCQPTKKRGKGSELKWTGLLWQAGTAATLRLPA